MKTSTLPRTPRIPGTCRGDLANLLTKGPRSLRDLLKALPKGRYTESTVKSTLSKEADFVSTVSPRKAGLRLWSLAPRR